MIRKFTLSFSLALTFTLAQAQTLKDEWVVCNTQGCKLLDPYFSDGVTLTWEGDCINGKANGFGKLLKYKNGEYESTYEGEFKNGIREGKGKFTHKDGTVREGQFVNGQLMGKGSMYSADGQRYSGEFVNYRIHGYGTVYFANGAKFEGFSVSDRMYTGKLTNYDGTITYLQAYYPVSKISEKTTGYKPTLGVRVTEYFDENWNRCAQKEAAFYRLVTYEAPNKPTGIVKDYYITGQLQSEFTAVYLDYDDEGKNFHEGEATWYFKNGNTEQKRYYYNNKINGKNTFYYDNGQVKSETNYDHGTMHGEYTEWYRTGNLKVQATYDQGKLTDGNFIEYDELGQAALVYNQIFALNKETWENKTDGSESTITSDNEVKLVVSKDKTAVRGNYIPLEQTSDYSIESIIQKKTGKGKEAYGMFFGFKDWGNYFQFLISEYGSYLILERLEGIDIRLKEWTRSDAINTGNERNHLKIIKLDDTFIFSINGRVIEKLKAKDLRGNNFGMIAYSSGEYILEAMQVKQFLATDDIQKKKPKYIPGSSGEWKGNGSGFFINEEGYIATNYHVIKDASSIQVEFYQKGTKHVYSAKVVATDKQNDLAVIQVSDTQFKSLAKIPYVFNTETKDVGTDVFALGYPLANVMGEEVKFTDGKISSKTGIQGDITVYQISVPIQPGNSGGPLFDSKGNLVGITSSALNKEYFNSENVNYAIKSAYLKNLIDVMPAPIRLPNSPEIYNKPLTEKIKLLSDFIPIIKVK
ncbi:MAG TPA: trypsin-like peptidase domain-containing protein [Cyclobacteriaceae bacterium]|nr:trypsin-like peptidase domain-containing protein [Cyclobacteriaceae bacterium]HMX88068.1 trypsin-like peptidase domain-containing protein [Saprospiraceae bacterium]HMX00901.1 trypsin-like peptidase domain-containing protein [Cyclobacteriaceae bacterium]HMY93705.1 trypsin-like peptidase domain-containing protein [Cyclobacteriaceae bacterium]HNA12861.1 trypsin-like peptidase domain-containing protein [Cyclobacteriaceae bacterium]